MALKAFVLLKTSLITPRAPETVLITDCAASLMGPEVVTDRLKTAVVLIDSEVSIAANVATGVGNALSGNVGVDRPAPGVGSDGNDGSVINPIGVGGD